MDQKTFAIIFIIVTAIAVGALTVNKFQEQASPLPSPQTSDNNLVFNQPSQSPTSYPNQIITPTPPALKVKQFKNFPILNPSQLQNKKVVIETKKGKIEFKIYSEATKAASSFIFLTNNNFFDGLTFHRVVPHFVIQGGDPLMNGTGGPGYTFADEPVTRAYTRGTVAMANAGPNTNGSQFFIMLEDHPELPPNYTIFGQVTLGQEVIEKIATGDTMDKVVINSF